MLIGICFLFRYSSFFVFIYFTFLCSFHCRGWFCFVGICLVMIVSCPLHLLFSVLCALSVCPYVVCLDLSYLIFVDVGRNGLYEAVGKE